MGFADQRGQDVAVGEVVVVVGAVKVGGHDAHIAGAVLAVAAFAQLDAGDLGDGIGLVGLFQRAGEKVVLPDRLRAVARVDATGAEKAQILDAGLEGAMDDVVLDSEVFVNEVGAVGVVGVNAADFCGGHEDVVGFLGFEEVEYGALIKKVELLPCAGDEVGIAARLQAAHDGGADHAAVAGDVNFRRQAQGARGKGQGT